MGVGTIQLKNHDGSIQVLTYVCYVPSLKKNLISLRVLESKGLTITLRDGLLNVVAGVLTVMKGTRRNNLYYLNGSTVIGSKSTASTKDADSEATRLWHMRLGHTSEKALQNLTKQGLLKGANSYKLEFCEHCVLGKQTRVKFASAIHNTKKILNYVHSDVWGPIKVASLGDNGTEYKNDPFLQVCQDEGIVRHFTIRDTLQQNGVVKRINQTILEKVQSAINGKTPMEMWTGKPATDYDSLHVFGSTTYYHVKESKLDPRAKKNKDSQRMTKPVVLCSRWSLKRLMMIQLILKGTNDEEVSTQELLQQQDSIAYLRPRREIRIPARFDDMVAYALLIADDDVPSTYTEARSNPDDVKWKQAMNEEMQSLHKNRTWELVTLPKGKKAIGCKWKLQKGIFIYLLLYVDDMLIASKSEVEIERLKTQLNLEFEMKDLGEGKKILSMEICRDKAHGRVNLSQKQYLKKAVSIVNKYMHNPEKGHWQAVKWTLRYIQKTMDVGLLFKQDTTLGKGVIGYVDSNYASDLDKRRSTTGYVFTLAGGPISLVQEHMNVYCDSQNAIHLVKNQVYHARTKHIDERFHFVREIIDEGKIHLQKIKTADNPADMMTKVVTTTKFEHCSNLINILQV
ncbi:hypothetical protein CXB51_006318 [Gossypium anomalum]|uniref:Integrase catalytic domain-containing protein n=1 Tax=Gossypium anomalum TaxID=47600 RepID=A0A8J6DAE2_9ROSI|nr:hypothetical protein CXB51_006318 [Gossypium anomalum]